MQASRKSKVAIIPRASDVVVREHSLQAIACELIIVLRRIWAALMLKRAIRFVESTREPDCQDINSDKAEILAALHCLHDEIVGGPLACAN